MNIARLLLTQCDERSDATAIFESPRGIERRITFAQLDEQSARAAAMLQASGLSPGDRVLVFHPMSIELYVLLTALFRLGLVATFLDPSAGRAHIDRCCEIVRPNAMIASSKAHALRLLSPALRRIRRKYSIGPPLPFTARWESWSRHAPLWEIVECQSADAALLTFTSGSTGLPKVAARSHGFLLAQHAALADAIALRPGQVDLSTLPIFTLANLASGVTTLIPDADLRRVGHVKPAPILAQVRAHRPDRVTASPAFLDVLVTECERIGATLDSFRLIHTGGAPVHPMLLRRAQATAPNARIVALYGSTEAEPIAHIAWHDMTGEDVATMRHGGGLLAGPVVPQVQLRIIPNQSGAKITPMTAPEFDAMCLPDGTPGEIVVCGEHVLKGYLNGVGDEQTKFKVAGQVWHRTGDSGSIDSRGRLWLLGRAEAVVRDERGVLFPFAVECAAMQIEGVRQAALVARAGKRVLVIEPVDAASSSGVEQRVLQGVAWSGLERVIVVASLPMDRRHNAKTDYPALHAMLDRIG